MTSARISMPTSSRWKYAAIAALVCAVILIARSRSSQPHANAYLSPLRSNADAADAHLDQGRRVRCGESVRDVTPRTRTVMRRADGFAMGFPRTFEEATKMGSFACDTTDIREALETVFACEPNHYYFRSQNYEDRGLFQRLYEHNPICNGVVAEMGALDGDRFSFSWFFEKTLHWRSILVEPHPVSYAALEKNRPSKLARKTEGAICKGGGKLNFYGSTKPDPMAHLGTPGKKSGEKARFQVQCYTIAEILGDDVPYIDIFVLDVEGRGNVENALHTMNWTIPVNYWMIELETGYEKPICEIMRSHGYREVLMEQVEKNQIYERTAFYPGELPDRLACERTLATGGVVLKH